MLLNGVNHVAILTHDTGRLVAFWSGRRSGKTLRVTAVSR